MPDASSVTVIVNAGAGLGCPPDWASELEQKFAAHGVAAQVHLIHDGREIPEAATRAVQQHAGLVIAAGGDGTVSAVASRLAGSGVALGVLPMGTLNHFAKDLGIPLERDAAIEVIVRRHEIAVDAGDVNGRVFINNSSLGLYPDIVVDRERQRRRLGRGKWRALLAACLHAARRYPVLTLGMEVDGKAIVRRSAFVFIGNNRYNMEGFDIGDRASISEGQLSLYVTQRTGRFGLLRLALKALARRLRQAEDFDMLMARELVVHSARRQIRVANDGEVALMQTPLNYSIRPGALRVIVPFPEMPTPGGP
ncbi:MAG: diacylglycerol kinase family protein [Ramlibacter sp.]